MPIFIVRDGGVVVDRCATREQASAAAYAADLVTIDAGGVAVAEIEEVLTEKEAAALESARRPWARDVEEKKSALDRAVAARNFASGRAAAARDEADRLRQRAAELLAEADAQTSTASQHNDNIQNIKRDLRESERWLGAATEAAEAAIKGRGPWRMSPRGAIVIDAVEGSAALSDAASRVVRRALGEMIA